MSYDHPMIPPMVVMMPLAAKLNPPNSAFVGVDVLKDPTEIAALLRLMHPF